jgi:hypothetical protein
MIKGSTILVAKVHVCFWQDAHEESNLSKVLSYQNLAEVDNGRGRNYHKHDFYISSKGHA